ncbi:MAG: hypothetical protein ABWX93_11085 [Pseudoxanthomonas sp.]
MTLRCLFVDFNSYFASVEQYDDPSLLGRPVGVVPAIAATTCCIANRSQVHMRQRVHRPVGHCGLEL